MPGQAEAHDSSHVLSKAAAEDLSRQISAHSEAERSRTWLGWAVGAAWSSDADSLRKLKELEYEDLSTQLSRKPASRQLSDAEVAKIIEADRKALELQDEIVHYGTGFLKTAALFMRGKAGLAGTVALYALDQTRHTESLKEQMADLALGGAKGGLLKGAFHVLGSREVGIAAKGVGLGVTSRVLDIGLSRQTYLDATTGGYDPATGLKRVVFASLNKEALLADVVVMGAAHGAFAGANNLAGGAIKRSQLLSTMFTGTTFGLSSGATGEILRQRQAGESLDLGKVATRALIQGAVDTFAAGPGGVQADVKLRSEVKSRYVEASDLLKVRLAKIGHPLDAIDAYKKEKAEHANMLDTAISVVSELQKAGHTAVFAGGSVRDEIMGRRPKDYDIATSATPEQVEKLFPRVITDGKDYGVIKVVMNGIVTDVATLRTDGQYSDGRRPDAVTYLTTPGEESLRADAARRDFTMNAMFKDPISGKIFDFFGGKEDIKKGVVRAVGNPGERILEDRLRMLRAARFSARYGFSVDPALEAAVVEHANKINGVNGAGKVAGAGEFGERSLLDKPVSGERVRDELMEILGSRRPLNGLDFMMRTGLMRAVLPEVAETSTSKGDQDPTWHPEGNTWVHTRKIVDHLSRRYAPEEVMLGGLLHDIGKPLTQERHPDGSISNHRHDEVGATMAEAIGKRIKLSNDQSDRVVELVRQHMRMHVGMELRPGKLAQLLESKYIRDLVAIQHADAMSTARPDRSDKSLRDFYLGKLHELSTTADPSQRLGALPLVNGQTLIGLGLKPGPGFKQMLAEAQEAQREGAFKTQAEALEWARQRFGKKS